MHKNAKNSHKFVISSHSLCKQEIAKRSPKNSLQIIKQKYYLAALRSYAESDAQSITEHLKGNYLNDHLKLQETIKFYDFTEQLQQYHMYSAHQLQEVISQKKSAYLPKIIHYGREEIFDILVSANQVLRNLANQKLACPKHTKEIAGSKNKKILDNLLKQGQFIKKQERQVLDKTILKGKKENRTISQDSQDVKRLIIELNKVLAKTSKHRVAQNIDQRKSLKNQLPQIYHLQISVIQREKKPTMRNLETDDRGQIDYLHANHDQDHEATYESKNVQREYCSTEQFDEFYGLSSIKIKNSIAIKQKKEKKIKSSQQSGFFSTSQTLLQRKSHFDIIAQRNKVQFSKENSKAKSKSNSKPKSQSKSVNKSKPKDKLKAKGGNREKTQKYIFMKQQSNQTEEINPVSTRLPLSRSKKLDRKMMKKSGVNLKEKTEQKMKKSRASQKK